MGLGTRYEVVVEIYIGQVEKFRLEDFLIATAEVCQLFENRVGNGFGVCSQGSIEDVRANTSPCLLVLASLCLDSWSSARHHSWANAFRFVAGNVRR